LLVSASTAPLRLLSLVGSLMALGGAAFGILLLVLRFAYGADWAAQGVFTIFALIFIFLGVQFVGMGLLGEYIGRISRDVQQRPRYLVKETLGRDRAPEETSPAFAKTREAKVGTA
jgi:undecaprenyl-phosphate 4-deoxy-4-formamido-L-arabinose transferase